MKATFTLLFLFIAGFSYSQNQAYYLSRDKDLKKVNLDSNKVIAFVSFLDTISISALSVGMGFSSFSDDPDPLPVLFLQERGNPFGLVEPTIQYHLDSLEWEGKYYRIKSITTDNHFVGGSPNEYSLTIAVKGLGVVYSYSHGLRNGSHLEIMICHSDKAKQILLTKVYERIAKWKKSPLESEQWDRIIHLTKSYSFNNLVPALSSEWLATRSDLKVIRDHVTVVEGKVIQSVVIKNVSNQHYYFSTGSQFGPSWIIYPEGDQRGKEKIGVNSYGTGYYPSLKNKNEPIFLAPDAEIKFDFEPDKDRICEACFQNRFSGVQVYGSRLRFSDWIFSEDKEINGNKYAEYHFNEIPK